MVQQRHRGHKFGLLLIGKMLHSWSLCNEHFWLTSALVCELISDASSPGEMRSCRVESVGLGSHLIITVCARHQSPERAELQRDQILGQEPSHPAAKPLSPCSSILHVPVFVSRDASYCWLDFLKLFFPSLARISEIRRPLCSSDYWSVRVMSVPGKKSTLGYSRNWF